MAHRGLIKIILGDALSELRIPLQWSTFRYIDREDMIDI